MESKLRSPLTVRHLTVEDDSVQTVAPARRETDRPRRQSQSRRILQRDDRPRHAVHRLAHSREEVHKTFRVRHGQVLGVDVGSVRVGAHDMVQRLRRLLHAVCAVLQVCIGRAGKVFTSLERTVTLPLLKSVKGSDHKSPFGCTTRYPNNCPGITNYIII